MPRLTLMDQAALLVERARAERGEGVEAFMYVARHLASLLLLIDPRPPDPVRKSQRVKPESPRRVVKVPRRVAPNQPSSPRAVAATAAPPIPKRATPAEAPPRPAPPVAAAPADVIPPAPAARDERARDLASQIERPAPIAVHAAEAVVRVEVLGTHGIVHYRDRTVEVAPRAAQLLGALAAAMPKPVDPHWLVKKLTWPTAVRGNVEIVHDIARNAGELVAPIGLRVLRIQGVGISLQEGT